MQTIAVPRDWIEAAIRRVNDPDIATRFINRLGGLMRAQDEFWTSQGAGRQTRRLVTEVDDETLTAFHEALEQRVLAEFPQATLPDREEALSIYQLTGGEDDNIDACLTVVAGIAARKPADYIHHIKTLLYILNKDGIEKIRREADARSRAPKTAAQMNQERRAANRKLAQESPPPGPTTEPSLANDMEAFLNQIRGSA